MSRLKQFITVILLIGHFAANAGDNFRADSIERLLPAVNENSRINLLLILVDAYHDSSFTKASMYAETGLALATKYHDSVAQISFNLKSAELLLNQGKSQSAITRIIAAMELSEEIDDLQLIVLCHLQIGKCYTEIEQYELAINYLNKALNIAQKNKDDEGVIEALNGLGNAISKCGVARRNEAMNYYLRGLSLAEEIEKPALISKLSNNLANIYSAQGYFDKSLTYYNKALQIAISTHNVIDEAFYNNNIGALYLKNNKADLAEKYQLKALSVAEQGNDVQLLINVYSQLSLTYEKLNKYVKAYNYKSKLFDLMKRLNSENSIRQIAEMQAKYESMQKQNEIIELQMKQKHNESQLANYRYGLFTFGIIILLSVFLLLILAKFLRSRKRNNELLKEKNTLIEKQNNKITDSINYAKRIQNSILPSKEDIRKILKQSFVLFLPKDIVSGDFYWMTKIDKKILVAVADCTGHGVPGAFMSMIGNTLLNEIINYQPHLPPSEILRLLNKRISSSLRQKQGEKHSQDDGMDISICCIDYEHNKIHFAGANHSIYTLVHGTLTEIRGDVFPVGGVFSDKEIKFADKEILLQPGMLIYMYSDGYKDQFGGADGQKFKSSRFEKLLSEIYILSMEEQEERLHSEFKNWKGKLSQLDDILVLGIRV